MFLRIFLLILPSIVSSTPILGGRDVGKIEHKDGKTFVKNPNKFPYLVFTEYSEIVFQNSTIVKQNVWQCGGVLITENVFLSAAHCLTESIGVPTISVRAGMIHQKFESDAQQTFVKDYQIYSSYQEYIDPSKPEYWKTHHKNDIALLWLERKITLNEKVNIGKISRFMQYLDGLPGIIAGWGLTNSGSPSMMLQEADVNILSNDFCQIAHKTTPILPSMICTLSEKRDVTHCTGDSGGPLIVNNVIVGIASWTHGKDIDQGNNKIIESCDPRFPSVFTRISYFRKWIDENVELGPPRKRNTANKITDKANSHKCRNNPKRCIIL